MEKNTIIETIPIGRLFDVDPLNCSHIQNHLANENME